MDSVQQLAELYFDQGGQNYIGEPVSQRDHALQAAALASDRQCAQRGRARRVVA